MVWVGAKTGSNLPECFELNKLLGLNRWRPQYPENQVQAIRDDVHVFCTPIDIDLDTFHDQIIEPIGDERVDFVDGGGFLDECIIA